MPARPATKSASQRSELARPVLKAAAKKRRSSGAPGNPDILVETTRGYPTTTSAKRRSSRLSPGMLIISGQDPEPFDILDFPRVYGASPTDRMVIIKSGIPASNIAALAGRMKTSQEEILRRLGLKKTTISRKAQTGQRLNTEQSESVLGLAKLVGQVASIVEESGDPEIKSSFDAAAWLEDWLSHPNPALGNAMPSTYLDTHEGREVLSTLIAQMQSGAYA